ncbi:LpxL/LpxP family Kdo(2)-lipid IV(A) lauroyl/palmitoleoyl acyltransferase [Pantoea sp. Mhis]|uniref:LpxL/LpxP family Kdo(2)-lipid IV(A) lauroyl/palmitoleoyl acyltransferase n=1 Tax=Pantoea sp. Mhis TaxID=2576759 RepID=UPI001357F017|nr:LpxL/LpxP family Kdo(2)-lipid IV(A) lauroyl/palmitoleoyl acyltransferase [Pantoea sp. Mhis]MXP56782.1 LpxL/LpxP family Kdo(2)-lipid IV(A) lauroyl/palmitoleoyl acyltransferase [Pantoea sp. Mhis]
MTNLPKFKTIFFHPRYWLTWLGILTLWCIVLLPYNFLYRIGHMLGKISMYFFTKRVNIARKNLNLCMPSMTDKEREIMLKRNFESVGMGIIETSMAWFWPDWRIKKWFTITGYENIKKVHQSDRGILLIGIHFLTLELGARILGLLNPGIGVYRPNNNKLIDWFQTKGRLRSNKKMINRYDLKGMIRALKQKEIIWYAPDHDYGAQNSVFVPFFGVSDTATTAGSYILIKSTHPAVISFIPKRKSHGKGYELIILPDFSNELVIIKNKEIMITKINKFIENAVMKAPEQYMWLHRRFKTRPPGYPSIY